MCVRFHRATRTFQAVLDWLTQRRIKTFVSTCQRSSFLYTCACDSSSGAFISYPDPRFPFPPKTVLVNKWFSVSAKGDGQGRKINVINVDQDGKTRKCYTIQKQRKNFPWSLEDLEDYEVFWTSWQVQLIWLRENGNWISVVAVVFILVKILMKL